MAQVGQRARPLAHEVDVEGRIDCTDADRGRRGTALDAYYQGKIDTCRWFCRWELPLTAPLADAVQAAAKLGAVNSSASSAVAVSHEIDAPDVEPSLDPPSPPAAPPSVVPFAGPPSPPAPEASSAWNEPHAAESAATTRARAIFVIRDHANARHSEPAHAARGRTAGHQASEVADD